MAGGDGKGKAGTGGGGSSNDSALNAAQDAVVNDINALNAEGKSVGDGNFLPIYHLRERLSERGITSTVAQNSLLYSLQRSGRIDMSSLHDQGRYSRSQMEQGILQDNGGYLFFISLT